MNVTVVGAVSPSRVVARPQTQAQFRVLRGHSRVLPPMHQCMLSDTQCMERLRAAEANPDFRGMFNAELNTTTQINGAGTITSIVFTLNPLIYMLDSMDIASAEYAATLEHEREHARNFFAEVERLRNALRQRSSVTTEELEIFLTWFDYKLGERDNRYHRSVGNPEDLLTRPLSPDPYP